jgi:hypothetical protein
MVFFLQSTPRTLTCVLILSHSSLNLFYNLVFRWLPIDVTNIWTTLFGAITFSKFTLECPCISTVQLSCLATHEQVGCRCLAGPFLRCDRQCARVTAARGSHRRAARCSGFGPEDFRWQPASRVRPNRPARTTAKKSGCARADAAFSLLLLFDTARTTTQKGMRPRLPMDRHLRSLAHQPKATRTRQGYGYLAASSHAPFFIQQYVLGVALSLQRVAPPERLLSSSTTPGLGKPQCGRDLPEGRNPDPRRDVARARCHLRRAHCLCRCRWPTPPYAALGSPMVGVAAGRWRCHAKRTQQTDSREGYVLLDRSPNEGVAGGGGVVMPR